MKIVVLSIAAMLSATPALAQDHSNHAGHTAQTAPATPAPATPAAPAAKPGDAAAKGFSLDTPIETLVADPRAKAAVDAAVPGVTSHASYEMFKSMSFNQLQPMAPQQLTPEVMAKLKTGLDAIK